MAAMRLGEVWAIALILFSLSGPPAHAQSFAECVRDAATRDLGAKTEFQNSLRDLIVRQHPEFAELADLNRDLQVGFAEARRARFEYLLLNDPGRIDTANGLSRFTNFNWTDADTRNFRRANDVYRVLEDRMTELRQRNDGHPDWPELRRHFRTTLNQSSEFMALTARLQANQRAIEARLARCRQR